MRSRVGQTWVGLVSTDPARALLVVRRLEALEDRVRYLCLDLESGQTITRGEALEHPWEGREGLKRLA